MPVIQLPAKTLRGLSFSLPELDCEDYEEVVAFHLGDSPLCRWIMWRSAKIVFIQPLIGRTQRYASVAEAFEGMTSKRQVALTDINPVGWPA
jgi:hypothetical protein